MDILFDNFNQILYKGSFTKQNGQVSLLSEPKSIKVNLGFWGLKGFCFQFYGTRLEVKDEIGSTFIKDISSILMSVLVCIDK